MAYRKAGYSKNFREEHEEEIPVSYTHLDVYKRQEHDPLRLLGFPIWGDRHSIGAGTGGLYFSKTINNAFLN